MSNLEEMADRLRIMAKTINPKKDDKTERLFRKYKFLLNKLKDKGSIGKLDLIMDNPRLNKNDLYWARKFDKSKSKNNLDIDNFLQDFKKIYRRNLPAAGFMKKVLDYGIENGHLSLNNMLNRKRVKNELLGEDKGKK